MRKQFPRISWKLGRGAHFASMAVFFSFLSYFLQPRAEMQAEIHVPSNSECTENVYAGAMAPTIISGERYVCPGSTETYTTPFYAGSTYAWTYNGPAGSIVNQSGPSVTIQWGNLQGSGPHIISVQETDANGVVTSDTFGVFIKNTILVCNDSVQVSLDAMGSALITPDMILEGGYVTYTGFSIAIKDQANKPVNNPVTCDAIGKILKVTVTGSCNQNSCWSTIYVEDKLAPVLTCPADTIYLQCFEDINRVRFPVARDNCDPRPVVNLVSEVRSSQDQCDTVYVKRTFIATDNKGNNSASCMQVIGLLPPPVPDFPKDIIFTCDQYQNDSTIVFPDRTGFPTGANSDCPIAVNYKDTKLEACEGVDTSIVFKILRNWTVLNWCTGDIYSDVQIIKVLDTVAPIIKRDTFSVNANISGVGAHPICRSTELLLPPVIEDNCSPFWTVQIFTPVGEAVYVNGVDGKNGGYIPAPGLPVGAHPIKYVAIDACGNRSEKIVKVFVRDSQVPIMVCLEYTEISLTLDGTAKACAEVFDEGSYDNCGIDTFLVKRMNEPDDRFRACLNLTCADDTVMVILRGYDYSGNHNDCMVELRVNDKLRPSCIPPRDVWTTCNEVPDHVDLKDTAVLKQLFGTASAFDNCNAWIRELTPTVDVNLCGIGTITRRFTAIDENRQTSLGTCVQNIKIKEYHDYTIYFPADWIGECHEIEDAPKVTFDEDGCDQIAVNYQDLRFNISSDGACYKIIRTWTVLNWCSYDGFSDPRRIPNHPNGDTLYCTTNNAFGFYQYEQLIKVIDKDAPELTYNGPTMFCGGLTPDCVSDGFVTIYPDIDEKCTNDIRVTWRLDLYRDGTYDANGADSLKRIIPIGKHRIWFEVKDGCGNRAQITIDFEVKDCKKPTPICHNGLSADIMQNGMLEIWASDFDNGSFDYCTPDHELRYRINRIEDLNNDRQITPADYLMTVPRHDSVIFRCTDFGLNYVQLWVGDNYNNWDFCVAFIDIQDNMFMCSTGSKIAGQVKNERGNGVQDVKMVLSGQTLFSMSAANGSYSFANVPPNHDYTVMPQKNTDPLNGVSTFDLALISKHILHTTRLNSPYKIIAADVNRSGTVTTLDLVEIRKLVLRVSHGYRNNSSWRFVPKSYQFANPAEPFAQPFPEVISFNNFSQDQLDADFVAIKVGDVNGDAVANAQAGIGNRSFVGSKSILVNNQSLQANEVTTIRFEVKDPADVMGYQFTLEFDPNALGFEGLDPNDQISEEHFGFAQLEEGVLTTSWFETGTALAGNKLYFDLRFRAKSSLKLHEVLKLTSRYTSAEAYDQEGQHYTVDLQFNDGSKAKEDFSLFQNKPNPFNEGTIIGFHLPEASTATISVFDVSGKLVRMVTGQYPKGYSEISLDKSELPDFGVYYYRLETSEYTATRKMMFIK